MNLDLLEVLLRFSKHSVAVTADIEKAFLQVSLAEEDGLSPFFLVHGYAQPTRGVERTLSLQND